MCGGMAKETKVLMGRYELGRSLGAGSFGKVYYARCLGTGEKVAIKIIKKKRDMKEKEEIQLMHEISSMRMVRHPNIVNIHEVMATRTKVYLVLEYAKGGELFEKIKKRKLKEELAHKYFRQLINAVDFCHSKGVYHRDIKPENLLIDGDGNLKVADFGCSALVKSKGLDGLLHTRCGTPAYASPEVINTNGYDGVKSDIWSCGVVLFVLLAGKLPFDDRNQMELFNKIRKVDFAFPQWFSKDVRGLLLRIFDPNRETRISIAKIKESSWLRKDFTSKASLVKDSKGKSISTEIGPSGSRDLDYILPIEESIRPTKLNAFSIVSLLQRLDYSGLFEDSDGKEERFTSRQSASIIVSWLIETTRCMGFKIKQIDQGMLNVEAPKAGKMGSVSIDVEIFEITTTVHLVEIRKSNGNTVDYQKMMEEDIRPALKDIVWAWAS